MKIRFLVHRSLLIVQRFLLGLHQELYQLMGFSRAPITRTKDLVADDSLPIDHKGHRETPSPIGQAHAIVGIVEDGKGQLVFLLKRPGDRYALRIGGYGKDLEIVP